MNTDTAEHPRERDSLAYYGECILIFTLGDQAYILGNIYSCGTGVSTRNKCSLTFCPFDIEVEQRSCRADLDAGPAELATGLLQRWGDSPCYDLAIVVDEAKRTYAPQVTASSDASGAADTEVVILCKQRLVLFNR
jgi:hypothetical protein